MTDAQEPQSQTPFFPTYRMAGHLLRVLNGVAYPLYTAMSGHIYEQRGNPQAQEDWGDPDAWIAERLQGDEQDLARRIWQESQGKLNPRHTRGSWWLAMRHGLLTRSPQNMLVLTLQGRTFLSSAENDVTAAIDAAEGVLVILRLVAERGPGRRGEFLPTYAVYCRTQTTAHSETVIKTFLYARLMNLVDRGFVARRGAVYQITDSGLNYLQEQAPPDDPGPVRRAQTELLSQAATLTRAARTQLVEYLATMNPWRFEELIALLLQEMGYSEVETTAPVNDKGVDVVANIELGISSVREVVQVKRQKGTIQRRILDELRGSLHRFHAVRGTIITTGSFSRGTIEAAFERGAAPITLIDGEKLVDLLIQYGIGVSKKTVEYIDFDPQKLAAFNATPEPDSEQ